MQDIGLRAGGEIFSAVVGVVIVGIGVVLLAGLQRPVAAPAPVLLAPAGAPAARPQQLRPEFRAIQRI
jgi:hypothetical protein